MLNLPFLSEGFKVILLYGISMQEVRGRGGDEKIEMKWKNGVEK